jgi:hypothetical protein
MQLTLNNDSLVLANNLRGAAMRASNEFNIVHFFADLDYAKTCLAKFASSDVPELATLAAAAARTLFPGDASGPAKTAATAQSPAETDTGAAGLSAGQRFTAAKELMNGLAVDAVGLRSFFFVLKLEKCGSGKELFGLMDGFQKLLVKGIGETTASAMTVQVRQLLGKQS